MERVGVIGARALPEEYKAKVFIERNERLVKASDGIVAFLYGESKGSSRTICSACAQGRKVVVFLFQSFNLYSSLNLKTSKRRRLFRRARKRA